MCARSPSQIMRKNEWDTRHVSDCKSVHSFAYMAWRRQKKRSQPLVFIAFTAHITAMMMPAPQQQLLSTMDHRATIPSGLSSSWQGLPTATAATICCIGGNERVGRHMHQLIRVLHLFGSNPKFSSCQWYWLSCASAFLEVDFAAATPLHGRSSLWVEWLNSLTACPPPPSEHRLELRLRGWKATAYHSCFLAQRQALP